MIVKGIFIITSIVLCSLLTIYKTYLSRQKRTSKTSVFVSFIAGFILFYSLFAIILAISVNKIPTKIGILLFGLSPFIIGKFATYKTETIFCWTQIMIVLSGLIFTLFI